MAGETPAPRGLILVGADPGGTTGLALVRMVGTRFELLEGLEVNLTTMRGHALLRGFMARAAEAGATGLVMERPGGGVYVAKRRHVAVVGAYAETAGADAGIGIRIAVGQGVRRGEVGARAIDVGIKVLPAITAAQVTAAVGAARSKGALQQALRLRGIPVAGEHSADATAVAIAGLKRLWQERTKKDR